MTYEPIHKLKICYNINPLPQTLQVSTKSPYENSYNSKTYTAFAVSFLRP